MIGCARDGVLRAHDVVGTRVGNSNRAVELFLALRFLVARHAGVIYVAVFCVAMFVVRGSFRQLSRWSIEMMV